MVQLEEEYFFHCPYCMAEIWAKIETVGGDIQSLVQDCEVCCEPIDIRLKVGSEGVEYFSAEVES